MKNIYAVIFFALLFVSCDKFSEEDYFMENLWEDAAFDYEYHNEHIIIFDEAQKERVSGLCRQAGNKDKRIAIFGGSHTCSTYSYVYREYLENYLGATISVYGVGGQGYATPKGSVQMQVEQAGEADIYILWCSTNDFAGSIPPGSVTDYTEYDNYDEENRKTQCGGLNYCIRHLKEKNPNAKIYVFGSQKFFTSEIGCVWDSKKKNSLGYPYSHYISLQEECARQAGVPYLDQWNTIPVDVDNYKPYFLSDHLHFSATGYANVALCHLEFLATN